MVRTKRRTSVAVLTAAVTVAAFGLSAAPANAAIGSLTARFTLGRAGPNHYGLRVSGLVRMTQAEAQALVNEQRRVEWRLWGEDWPDSDDFRHGPDPASIVATSRGLEFNGQAVVRKSVLNEDGGFRDRDELYVGVRLLNSARTRTVRAGESNRVFGRF